LGLPLVPVVGLIRVDLGQESVEALRVAARNHAGGDELAQGLQVLILGGRSTLGSGGATTIADLTDLTGITVLGVGGLQVGQKLGVNAITTITTTTTTTTTRAIGVGRAAGSQDDIDDLLARGSLGDAEGSPRAVIPALGTRLTPAHHHVLLGPSRSFSSVLRMFVRMLLATCTTVYVMHSMHNRTARADVTAICQ